jgi:hypothetical protein
MNSPLSLVQELRGIRGGPKQMQSDLEGLLAQIEEARREWQTEMDQAQQIFRDLLTTISELSGVELPTISLDAQRGGNAPLQIGFKTLKERIRNDLEAFSSSAALEVGKRAHEQGHTLLEPLEKEMGERLDHLAEEFRAKVEARLASGQDDVDKLARSQVDQVVQAKMEEFAQWINLMSEGAVSSVPSKVEEAVEPHIREVSDRLKATFQQQLHFVLHDQEKVSQEKVRELQEELRAQLAKLSDQARESTQQVAETAIKSLSDRLAGVTDEAARNFDSRIDGGVERSLGHFRQRLGELSNSTSDGLRTFADQQAEVLNQRLQKTAEEMHQKAAAGISENIDKITKDALDSSLQNLRGQLDAALETSKGELKTSMQALMENVQKQMGELGKSAHTSLSQDVARLSTELRNLGEELKAAEADRVTAAKNNLTLMAQNALDSVSVNLKQLIEKQTNEAHAALRDFQTQLAAEYQNRYREAMNAQQKDALNLIQQKGEEAVNHAVAQISNSSDQVIQGLADKVNKEVNTATSLLKDWANQTTAWAESTIKTSFENYQNEIARLTTSVLENQRNTIDTSMVDLQKRLEDAAALLRGVNGNKSNGVRNEAA